MSVWPPSECMASGGAGEGGYDAGSVYMESLNESPYWNLKHRQADRD